MPVVKAEDYLDLQVLAGYKTWFDTEQDAYDRPFRLCPPTVASQHYPMKKPPHLRGGLNLSRSDYRCAETTAYSTACAVWSDMSSDFTCDSLITAYGWM